MQAVFLLLNVWICFRFVLFVRQFEGAGGPPLVRPAGVEGWLPIAALMNLKYLLVTGSIPAMHPAAMFLLIAFLIISVVFRKAFCSWLCPVGTLSEALWKLGRRVWKHNLTLPRWLDIPLRGLKYLLLGLFLYALGTMTALQIRAFLEGPYGIVADVKMLNFFRYMSATAACVLAAIVVLSVLIKNFWCRYLCPYGALMGFAALISPAAIRRDPDTCIDCAKCARSCPAMLPVDRLVSVRSAECTGCLECVAVCPVEGALALSFSLPRRRKIPAWSVAVGISVLFLGMVGVAIVTGHWDSPIPRAIYGELIPQARTFTHP